MTVALGTNIANPIRTALSQWLGFDTMGKLANYGKLGVAAAPSFSPANLFASGEQGAWYDPSDLTTMFQDSSGTVPVTTDNNPVALRLDKSKGLTLSGELITNANFSDGTTGWSVGSGWTISGGVASATSGTGELYSTTYSFVQGKAYLVSFDKTGTNVVNVYIKSGGIFASSAAGRLTCYIVAGATTRGIGFYLGAGGGTIDNISVKEVAGNHSVQATTSKRAIYKVNGLAKYLDYDGVDDVLDTIFPSSLGSSCTVATANVGGAPTILTGQTIGTTYAGSTDNAGLIIVNRALTSQETTDVTAWLTAKGATA